jgi:hypothetical protein
MMTNAMSRVLAFFLLLVAAAGEHLSAAPAARASCTAPEYRQLDFWIGDWDVSDADGTPNVARVRVERVLDGCALKEDYEDPTGLRGQSLSTYDASRGVWHQTWVTNRGQLLMIEGKMRDGALVLSGSYRAATGEETNVRGTWTAVNGGVREAAVTSTDGGKTWKPWFDLLFRSHARTPGR